MTKFRRALRIVQGASAPVGQFEDQLVEDARLLSVGRFIERMNRRNFVSTLGLAAGAAGVLGITGCSDDGSVTLPPSTTVPSVVDVLNFALNLEYLEASFYLFIATGTGLSTTDLGSGAGAISGGAKVTFTNAFVNTIAQNLATEEQQHVEFLRATITTLGGTPVSAPALNLAALGTVNSDATFVAMARQLETVGTSAYAGGAQYLTSSTTAVQYAAQILDVEAQHEGALRQACIQLGVTSPAADSMDVPPTSSAVFNTGSTTGLNAVRTTSQVLQIVYNAAGKTGVTSGGFFPSGMNGNIKST